jgi:hypothetical protein
VQNGVFLQKSVGKISASINQALKSVYKPPENKQRSGKMDKDKFVESLMSIPLVSIQKGPPIFGFYEINDDSVKPKELKNQKGGERWRK